jgi:hypothetical protein
VNESVSRGQDTVFGFIIYTKHRYTNTVLKVSTKMGGTGIKKNSSESVKKSPELTTNGMRIVTHKSFSICALLVQKITPKVLTPVQHVYLVQIYVDFYHAIVLKPLDSWHAQ